MRYLLDTNVISELQKKRSRRADPDVVAWAASVTSDASWLSSVTVFETERGVLRKERSDPMQGEMLRRWWLLTLGGFQGRILPIDADIARRAASLHVPDPRPERDAFIAATALVHGLTVVTRNTRDFAATGVPLLNPWEWRQ